MRCFLVLALAAGALAGHPLAAARGQTTIVAIAKLAAERRSDTQAVLSLLTPTIGTIEISYRGPTGSFGVWTDVREHHKVETLGKQTRITMDKLRGDLPYHVRLRLRSPKSISDPVSVIVPLYPLDLFDGQIDFKKFKGAYRFEPYPIKKNTKPSNVIELTIPKGDAKKDQAVDIEVFAVRAGGKFFSDERGDAITQKFRVTFGPKNLAWTGSLDEMLKTLRKQEKVVEFKSMNFLILYRPVDEKKINPLELALLLRDVNGKVLIAQPLSLDFEGIALATLVPVRFSKK